MLNKSYILFLTIVLSIFSSDLLAGNKSVPFNSTDAKIIIDSLKQENQYDYNTNTNTQTGFWQQLKWEIRNFFNSHFNTKGTAYILRYLLMIGVVVFLIIYFVRSSIDGGVARKNVDVSSFEHFPNKNPTKANFDIQIEEAVAENNYRLAIRFLYLKTLQYLNYNNLIVWDMYKTNTQFIHEISNNDMSEGFARLCRVFDYVWYGETSLSSEKYLQLSSEFNEFVNKINTHDE